MTDDDGFVVTGDELQLTHLDPANATRTPGDSARFTRVELSEKAMTMPTTASTPKAFALSARVHVGEAVVVIAPTTA